MKVKFKEHRISDAEKRKQLKRLVKELGSIKNQLMELRKTHTPENSKPRIWSVFTSPDIRC